MYLNSINHKLETFIIRIKIKHCIYLRTAFPDGFKKETK